MISQEIHPAELQPLLENGSVHLLDVREPFEVAGGIIPGALHIPLGSLTARYGELPTDKAMVVYCAHGMRSLSATRFLQSVGFDVRSLAGGIVHWQAKGGKVGAP